MIASILLLSRADIKALRIKDTYSLHRVVYNLFDDIRNETEKKSSIASGILYADKGYINASENKQRKILILSNRLPNQPQHGLLSESKNIPGSFLQYDNYGFEAIINPTKRDNKTGKTVAICGRDAVTQWFIEKAPKSWGFTIKPESMQIQNLSVQQFAKNEHTTVTQGKAIIKGELQVTNREQFIQSFESGIGRGRAFGFGLLQIVPLIDT